MNTLHQFLKEKLKWYREFHELKHSHFMLWAFFIAYSVFATYAVYSGAGFILPDTQSVLAKTATTTTKNESNITKVSNSAVIERLRGVNAKALAGVKSPTVNSLNAASVTTGTSQLVSAFNDRQKTLTELAFTNPREVRMFVLDQNALNAIPKEAQMVSEVPFNKKGKFSMWVAGGHGHGEYTEEYYLEVSSKERYRLSLTPEEARRLQPRSDITVKGMKLTSNTVIPAAAPTQSQIKTAASVSVPGTLTTKKIAVVAFNFQNDKSMPFTTAELRRIVFTDPKSVAAYYKEVSEGQWQLQGRDRVDGDIYGWITINMNVGGACDYFAWRDAVKAKLDASGVNLLGYTNVIYVFPNSGNTQCQNSGISGLNGETFQMFSASTSLPNSVPLIVHELGHSYGFDHASGYGLDGSCKTGSSYSGPCEHREYGDTYDPMGIGGSYIDDDISFPLSESPTFHFNIVNKAKLWLRPEQVLTVTKSGTYELSPSELSSSGYKVIRIPRPFATGKASEQYVRDGYYYLEYRRPFGFDAFPGTATVVNSVGVRLASGDLAGYHGTYWLGIRDGRAITPGKPLTDDEGGVVIRVSTTTPTKAVVDISITPKPVCLGTPLEALSLLPASFMGTSGSSVHYELVVRNNDAQGCTQRNFRAKALLAGGSFPQTPDEILFSLNPGETKTLSFDLKVPTGTPSGLYTFYVSVIENFPSNTHSFATALIGANIYVESSRDSTPPVVSITEPVQDATTVKVLASATDESAIASMDILIDGNVVKTCASTNTTDTSLSCAYPITTLAIGGHRLTVKAMDISGNTATKEVNTFKYLCTRRTPVVTVTRTDPGGSNPWKKIGETAYYSVKVIHKSSPECGAGVYKLEALTPSDIQASMPSVPPGMIYITGADGSGATVVLVKPLAGATPGSKQITIKVTDVTGFTDTGTPPLPLLMAPTDLQVSTTTELVVMATNDTTVPTIMINAPRNGEVVKTIPKITTTASDPSGVMSMFVMLDTVLLKNCVIYPSFQTSSTCVATTSSLTPGLHTITFMAKDGSSANNSSTTKSTFTYTP